MKLNFSIEPSPEKTSKAMGKELHISRKQAHEIATAIKGMKLDAAREFLENVAALKQAVPYKRYVRNIPHRRGMCSGRYPQKAAKEFLCVLKNAESNFRYFNELKFFELGKIFFKENSEKRRKRCVFF